MTLLGRRSKDGEQFDLTLRLCSRDAITHRNRTEHTKADSECTRGRDLPSLNIAMAMTSWNRNTGLGSDGLCWMGRNTDMGSCHTSGRSSPSVAFKSGLAYLRFPINLHLVPCVQNDHSLVTPDLLYGTECDRSNMYGRLTRILRLGGNTTVAAGRYNRSRHGDDLTR